MPLRGKGKRKEGRGSGLNPVSRTLSFLGVRSVCSVRAFDLSLVLFFFRSSHFAVFIFAPRRYHTGHC